MRTMLRDNSDVLELTRQRCRAKARRDRWSANVTW